MKYPFAPPAAVTVPIVGRAERFPVHRIYGLVRNHAAHAREMGFSGAEAPFFFLKAADADAVVAAEPGQTASIRYPSFTRLLHHEIELVVAIGASGRNVEAADARALIYGYAVGLDMTRQDLQDDMARQGRPWCIGKSFDHAAVVGPIVPADRAGDVDDAELYLRVNGQERQRSRVSRMIWDAAMIIEQLSTAWELRPGDLIYTGTPDGVGPVLPGDTLEGGVGTFETLKVTVTASGSQEHGETMSNEAAAGNGIVRYVCEELTKPLPVYAHATVYAGVAQVSAVQGFVPGTFQFPEGGAGPQAEQMMQNLSKILKGVGSGFDRILKMTLYFTNLDRDFAAVNEVVNRYIPEHSPARSSIGVAALPRAATVVVDCSAAVA